MTANSDPQPSGTGAQPGAAGLRQELTRLAPWHLDVQITPELSTRAFRDGAVAAEADKWDVGFIDHREGWIEQMRRIYPDGLAGRRTLDCACNCGGYSFWMREMGSDGGLGFDVRQHWIDQARFLQANRQGPSDRLRFEVCDLYELPVLTDEEFDITLFKGILYHLPDPIHGLKLAADRTRELLIVNTAARNDLGDGMLVAEQEGVENPMSGVYGLTWLPTGPNVVAEMLKSMGFAATRTTFWRRELGKVANRGRLEVIGARDEAVFEHFDEVRRELELQRAENVRRAQQQQARKQAIMAERAAQREAERKARREQIAAEQQARKQATMAERAAQREAERKARREQAQAARAARRGPPDPPPAA
jgi:tRNA (mo5U34)-methyltransferase